MVLHPERDSGLTDVLARGPRDGDRSSRSGTGCLLFEDECRAASGVSMPSHGNPYGGVTMPQHDRQAKVMAAKQRSRCRSCGQMGHWQRDPICPNRGKGKSKGHGKRFGGSKDGGSKSKFGGKGRRATTMARTDHQKARKITFEGGQATCSLQFALNDADESGGAGYMAYRGSVEDQGEIARRSRRSTGTY